MMDQHFVQQLLIGAMGMLLGSASTGWAILSKLGSRVAVLESARSQEREDTREIKTSIAEIYKLLRDRQ